MHEGMLSLQVSNTKAFPFYHNCSVCQDSILRVVGLSQETAEFRSAAQAEKAPHASCPTPDGAFQLELSGHLLTARDVDRLSRHIA